MAWNFAERFHFVKAAAKQDEVLATALLARLLHHAEVIPMNGSSYRMKDR
jgi:DNA replication protein DnaC